MQTWLEIFFKINTPHPLNPPSTHTHTHTGVLKVAYYEQGFILGIFQLIRRHTLTVHIEGAPSPKIGPAVQKQSR